MAAAHAVVKPNYTTTAYVVLVPPAATADKPGEPTQDQRNVWLSQGLLSLANAASVAVLDPTVPDELTAAGFSNSFTTTMNDSTALITFAITGKSADQANATADELVRRYSESVKSLQDQAHIAVSDEITASRLGSSQGAVESSGNVKRALAAVGGAGLLLTAGLTVGVDALLRRRVRRRLDHEATLAPDPIAPAPRGTPSPEPVRPASTVSSNPFDQTDASGKLAPVYRVSYNGAAAESKDFVGTAEAAIQGRPSPGQSDVTNRLASDVDRQADTTIVLPLDFRSGRNNGDRKGRP
jgi:capsular polysaccharide biosynthesis protein